MSVRASLTEELAALARADRLRDAHPVAVEDPRRAFTTNDYLGLGGRRAVLTGAIGARAARLLGGDEAEHRAVEGALAAWTGLEEALVFTSGYAANVGALSALAGPEDFVASDALNHASIIDGLRLGGAMRARVPHNDVAAFAEALARPEARRARRRWVVVESYYSMDADGPDLRALAAVCAAADAGLYVDEAHALGVDGPEGAGRCRAAGITPDVLVGTFGKSLGTAGAFVAGAAPLRSYLWNRARSFVFSTGMSPAVAGATAARVAEVRAADDLRAALGAATDRLREGLAALGVPALGAGPIVPVVLGAEARALAVAGALREAGFSVFAVRPPTVPPGTSRLRLTVSAHHRVEDVDALLAALGAMLRGARIDP